MFKKLIASALAFYTCLAMAAIDVNKATLTELTEIKGIGPATASRIVDARKQGPFKSWDDLIQRVKGIAQNSANKLSSSGLTVNGQAFRPGIPPAAKPSASQSEAVKPAQTASKKAEKS